MEIVMPLVCADLGTRTRPAGAGLDDAQARGRVRGGQLAPARSGDLGGPWRAQALHLVQADVLGGLRPGRPPGQLHGDRELAASWRKAAEEIHADICEHAVDERGVFVQHDDTTALDASVLLMPLRFLPADDPRIRKTVLAVAEELTVDELVLRYRVQETDDGFAGEEGRQCVITREACCCRLDSLLGSFLGRRGDRRGG
jgi:hypothetical protein